VAGHDELDAVGKSRARCGPLSLRWVLVCMIEEYGRHNGYVDPLRERIDGAVGGRQAISASAG